MTDPTDSIRRRIPSFPGCGFVFLLALCGLLAAGCRPKSSSSADAGARVTVEFQPAQPVVGATSLTLTLTDAAGQPLHVGELQVEGDMNHAGMKPVFARLQENAPGRYTGEIEFSMGGDWFLLVTGKRPNGDRLEKRVDVPGVRTK